jgi:hypothetical protein
MSFLQEDSPPRLLIRVAEHPVTAAIAGAGGVTSPWWQPMLADADAAAGHVALWGGAALVLVQGAYWSLRLARAWGGR